MEAKPVKHGTITLVKFKALVKRLDVPMYRAVGILESLWIFAQHNARDGNLSGFTPLEIAGWIDWEGDEIALIDALVETRWLDRNGDQLLIHDWQQHAPNWVKGEAASPVTKKRGSAAPSVALSATPRARVARTKPNLTKPNHRRVKAGRGSLSKVSDQLLSDDAALGDWIESAIESGVIEGNEASVLRAFGAAERAIEEGDNPPGLFVSIVKAKNWSLITQAQEDRARRRVRDWRRGQQTGNGEYHPISPIGEQLRRNSDDDTD